VVTMADVAARAGVSVSTVSHVLNDTRPVSEALAGRVRRAVEATGYSPNAVARSLATSRTRLLGMVLSATSDPFFGRVFSTMEGTARQHGYSVLLSDNSHGDLELGARQVRLMLDQQISGLVLAPMGTRSGAVLDTVLRRGVPAVLVDRFVDDRFDQVGAENLEATAGLVTHLAELGHRRIAFVAGRGGLSTTTERLAGYRAGLERNGLAHERRLVRVGGSRADPAQAATRALLEGDRPPTAVISGNNEMSIGVFRALRAAGLRIPGDVAVVGYDDVAHGDLVDPPLTALAQPVGDIGRVAVELLIARIEDPCRPTEQRRMAPTLVHRRSCGCPAGLRAAPPSWLPPRRAKPTAQAVAT
jgi:LacI family transcriptional regulator